MNGSVEGVLRAFSRLTQLAIQLGKMLLQVGRSLVPAGLFIVDNDTQSLDDDLRSPAVLTGPSLTIKFSRMIDLLR